MKKIILIVLLPLMSHVGYSIESPDWALKKGAFGIGVHPNFNLSKYETGSSTKLGLAFSGRYALTDLLTVQLSVGLGSLKNKYEIVGFSGKSKTSGIQSRLEVQLPIRTFESDAQAIVLLPFIGTNIFSGNTSSESMGIETYSTKTNAFQFDVGIKVEWFVSNFSLLSAPISIGVGFSLAGIDQERQDGSEDTIFWTFSQPTESLSFINSTFGFHYYFF